MKKLIVIVCVLVYYISQFSIGIAQSPSFKTYTNPVIPGDHSDCTLTQVGSDFYTTGSSFNPTPVIYHSTDLIHWEAIAQPVSAAWASYGNKSAGGCWGGQIVYYNHKWWDFFGKSFAMYFTTADKPQGPWSTPTPMNVPSSVPGFGADNSIFIDTDSTWYLLVKNGQPNNWIVQLGKDGQPSGAVYNLTWLNPSPSYPYSWAEGPVMWKYKGYYFYSFARDVSGGQKVMRSNTLTGDKTAWSAPIDFFNENDPGKPNAIFSGPNHSSAAIILNDSTSWVMHPVWARANSNEWYGQGRQGLVNQVNYNASTMPVADYPDNKYFTAPKLPSSGIPWMVPKSDFFNSDTLNPEWSFLGYTPTNTYSLTERRGWLRLKPRPAPADTNTVIKTDAEHNYSLITRMDFNATSTKQEAGLKIINGLQATYAKVYSSFNSSGVKVICFSFKTTYYEAANNIGNVVWLKMVRVNHVLSGYFSADGINWKQVGKEINIASLDNEQPSYNGWCGNRQGLYVQGANADFDMYIYRDPYTPILASCPANQFGTIRTNSALLDSIHNNDWALYAGVEFGNKEYAKAADSIQIIASSATAGGTVEVWLDSIDTGNKIGTCNISNTGGWSTFKSFTAKVNQITGRHDVYLKFTGSGTDRLFQLQWVKFISKNASGYVSSSTTSDSSVVVKLNRAINTPASATGFTITLNGSESDSITQTIVNSLDSSMISFNVKKKFINTDVIKISFTSGNNNSLYVFPFVDTIVDNLLPGSIPHLTEARTSLHGDSVILKFNKKMNSPVNYVSEFKITTDLLGNPINSIGYKNTDSTIYIIVPKYRIYFENVNTVDYTGTDIKSIDLGIFKKVVSLHLINGSLGYPPALVSAALRKSGSVYNNLALKFDRPLADVSNQLIYFSLTINGQMATLKSISGSIDSTILFSVNPFFNNGDIVKISYSGGTVASTNGGILADISDYLVSNNIPVSIKTDEIKFNSIKVYPNPVKQELNITSGFDFNSVSIFDLEGKLLLEKYYGKNMKAISLPLSLNKGIYILKLGNNSSVGSTKIVIQ